MSLETTKFDAVTYIKLPASSLVRNDLEITLRNELRDTYEGICNQDGFVKKVNSINYVGKGKIIEGDDKCPVTFAVSYNADIIKIYKDNIIFGCRIKMIEEFGIVCTKDGIIDIVIKSTDLPDNFQNLFKINDLINIRALIDGEFTVKGNRIYTIGKIHYLTVYESLDKMCKFLVKDYFDLTDSKIKVVTDTDPAPVLPELGFDQDFEDYKNAHGDEFMDKSSKEYRLLRDSLNPYELLAPSDYYLKITGKHSVPKIQVISRAYFKMWEILKTFPKLIDTSAKSFISANLAEGPGGFIQATMDYRDKYSADLSANDKFYAITLPGKSTNSNEIPQFDQSFVKKNSKRLTIMYGDITDPKGISEYIAKFKTKANLVTGDAGFQFDVAGKQLQEHITQQIIFSQLFLALNVQAVDGSFVCKIFDAYTEPTVFILQLAKKFYRSVILFKPETSRPANSERYLICYRFGGITPTELKNLGELHAEWKKIDPSGGLDPTKFIVKITGQEISSAFKEEIKAYNTKLAKYQKEKIREIVSLAELKIPIDTIYYSQQEQIAIDWCKKMDIPY
jgi:23S rRNA U2552 (ribose-2'-O)-methylase RlmE/FtsJ